MKLIITIALGNDAMRTPRQALDAIRKTFVCDLSADVPLDQQVTPIEGKIRDDNGNTVGSYAVTRAK